MIRMYSLTSFRINSVNEYSVNGLERFWTDMNIKVNIRVDKKPIYKQNIPILSIERSESDFLNPIGKSGSTYDLEG